MWSGAWSTSLEIKHRRSTPSFYLNTSKFFWSNFFCKAHYMYFAYYLAAIGEPNLDRKREILYNNVKTISEQIGEKIDLFINDYSLEFQLDARFGPYVDETFIFRKKGIIAELWLTNHYNYKLFDYDYMLMVLDDVDITTLSIKDLIANKEKYDVKLISPKVKNATHPYMFKVPPVQPTPAFAYTNQLEFYCYLLKPEDFFRYLSFHDIENPFIWGVDLMFKYYNFSTGLDYTNEIDHCMPARNYDNSKPMQDMKQYLNKRGFESFLQVQKLYPPICQVVSEKI